uniref:Beta-lactamase n=1 Tax=Panagrolaimus superbus TaxID=310955 RepID=A0A914YTL6_9BILA
MPEEIYHNYEKLTKSLPGIGDILKGHQFLNGNGERQDFKKAAEFYAKAANMGYPEGMYNLGQLYYEGNGVKRDYKEAMKWFLKAANLKPSDVTVSHSTFQK